MTDFIDDHKQPLADLRREIDRIDSGIIDLLAQRLAVVETVAQQKIQQGLVFRARREIEKMCALEALADQHNIPVGMVFDLWRVIMSTASNRQRPFRLICLGSSHLAETALAHFGRDIPISVSDDLPWVLAQQQAEPDSVMCLFDAGRRDWWPAIAQVSDRLSIVAELPWRGNAPPSSYLLAHSPLDLEAGADVLCTVRAPKATEAEIRALFSERLLHIRADKAGDYWLVRLRDAEAHDSFAGMLLSLQASLPADCSLGFLGRFPSFHQGDHL